mmetsp:Transcript_36436/g.89747  ORF Transcript_36436/g.89747 Transcript_36436/m.89747 type:complete len:99 (+) Transcript_36436:86-382(+)
MSIGRPSIITAAEKVTTFDHPWGELSKEAQHFLQKESGVRKEDVPKMYVSTVQSDLSVNQRGAAGRMLTVKLHVPKIRAAVSKYRDKHGIEDGVIWFT